MLLLRRCWSSGLEHRVELQKHTFQRNIRPPSSGCHNKEDYKPQFYRRMNLRLQQDITKQLVVTQQEIQPKFRRRQPKSPLL
jgi:hypothetical protein